MTNQIAPLEIGITVRNLGAMISFYRDVLCFNLISEIDVDGNKSLEAGFVTGGYRIVRMETNYGERIKLVRPVIEPGERASGNEVLSTTGNVFLTFIVDDLKSLVKRVKTAGVPKRTQDDITEVRPGIFLSIFDDPEGNHLEFVEYRNIAEYRPQLK